MRDELVNEVRQSLQNLVKEIRDGLCTCPQIGPMMMELSMQKNAAEIVGGFIDELFGEELIPWQSAEKPARVR